MNINEAVKILWANACCTLADVCNECSFSDNATEKATPECENMNEDQLRVAVKKMAEMFKEQKHEISNMLTISTAHIKPETAKWLERQWEIFDSSIVIFSKGVYGWFVLTDYPEDELQEVYNTIPDDLVAIFKLSKELCCEWVCLDRDAETVPDLLIYEW